MIFLNGEASEKRRVDDEEQPEEERTIPPQWPYQSNEDFIVMYPVLAYKSVNPRDNEVIFANLVQNTPQKVVSIAPFKFV